MIESHATKLLFLNTIIFFFKNVIYELGVVIHTCNYEFHDLGALDRNVTISSRLAQNIYELQSILEETISYCLKIC